MCTGTYNTYKTQSSLWDNVLVKRLPELKLFKTF